MELQGRSKYFADLTPEIRIMIWKAAALLPRVVVIGLEDNVLTTKTTPTLLHICRESRYYGLKAYTLNLGSTPTAGITIPAKIWINPHIDCVAFQEARGFWDDVWRGELRCLLLWKSIGEQTFAHIRHLMQIYSEDIDQQIEHYPHFFVKGSFDAEEAPIQPIHIKKLTLSWRNWEAMSRTGHDEIPARSQHCPEPERDIRNKLEVVETGLREWQENLQFDGIQ